ncbi:MAG: type II toxin-antitoxin system VapC family toxin [Planctomycetes bacterium]|nr:type II toxin-antitoxin system VapC family toxin [Planctomycetota bacterium]
MTAILLDTHVWVWQVSADPALSRHARAQLDDAADAGDLIVSAVSVWEIALLEARGRLTLDMECLAWVRRAVQRLGLRVVPLSMEVAVASTRLPGDFHADPADRFLVATARHLDVPLATADGRILKYAAAGHVRVLRAG